MSEDALASDTAMVMAAGLGKRMRPLTARQPKPLVRVAGKALIDYSLDGLAAAGVAKAVVNVHYLAEALEAHLAARKRGPAITISDEREHLLETGGGMVKAAPSLPDPFFCLNSDNIWLDGPRNAFADCSPSTQRMASEIFDFPHPFGPTMAATPGTKFRVVLSAKDLKPRAVRLLRYMTSALERNG